MKKTLIYLTLILQITACGSSDDTGATIAGEPQNIPVENSEPFIVSFSSTAARSTEFANQQDVDDWSSHVNLFSFNEFSAGSSSVNFLSAPYNQISLFALLSAVAKGNGLEQINDYFGFHNNLGAVEAETFFSVFNTFDQSLTANAGEYTSSFSSVNSMWGQQNYAFSPSFLDLSVTYFGAELFSFDPEANPLTLSSSYLQQFKAVTNQILIPDTDSFIRPNETSDEVLLLSHLSLLDGNWEYPFNTGDTELGNFKLLNSTIIEVPVMHGELDTQYYIDGEQTLIALPTSNPDLTIYIYSSLNVETHHDAKNVMTLQKLNTMISQSTLSHIQLSMPTFSISRYRDAFAESFAIFDKYNADLSGLSESTKSELYVFNYQSQSFMEFNEQGIKIVGETLIGIKIKPVPFTSINSFFSSTSSSFNWILPGLIFNQEPIKVSLSSPFLYFVYHKPTGTVLYSGNLVDPSKS